MKPILGNDKLAAAFCLVGRAFDFVTTWVALELGRAAEGKPGAAQFIHSIGPTLGLIIWEFAITTPAIFLGCYLAEKIWSTRRAARGGTAGGNLVPPGNPLFYSVGVISFIIGLHNFGYIF